MGWEEKDGFDEVYLHVALLGDSCWHCTVEPTRDHARVLHLLFQHLE